MCAGAVREAVFSNPEVIRRINADFVPLSLNMLTPLQRSGDDEGRLFQAIYRSRVQPQGTCVLNSAGQVLAWVLMYEKNESVLDFLDHGLRRFGEHPDGKQPILTERYMRFPNAKLEDYEEDARPLSIAEGHPEGKSCQAQAAPPKDAVIARVFGRALDADGKLSADTVNQEHSALDRFTITAAMQEALAKAFANAGTDRIKVPDAFARLCVTPAYLGNKDMGPLAKMSVLSISSKMKQCEFWAQKVGAGSEPVLLRVTGQSDVTGEGDNANVSLRHDIKLTWEGFIEMNGNRMTRLLLLAHGTEKLKWGSAALTAQAQRENEVAFLPAGRPVDLSCAVRYGIMAEQVAAPKN